MDYENDTMNELWEYMFLDIFFEETFCLLTLKRVKVKRKENI